MVYNSNNVKDVLKNDGVDVLDIVNFQNISNINVQELVDKFGKNNSWAVRVTFNKRFGGVVIQQLPGEGNRLHMHPNEAECWVILKGKWKWFIEGQDDMEVSEGSIVNVPPNSFHQITCLGEEPGIRFAVTAPDVDHAYK